MIEEYFKTLEAGLQKELEIARTARAKGLDPEDDVEIRVAADIAARIDGLLKLGVEEYLRDRLQRGTDRKKQAFEIAAEIAGGRVLRGSEEKLADAAVRVATAVLTEGVAVAPTEGIAQIMIEQDYLRIKYAGPIRSAGGTVAALTVALADRVRREMGLGVFVPTEKEVERYVEEINLYHTRLFRLQFKPSDDVVRTIVRNCPVMIDGDPVGDKLEVSATRDLERIGTNRIRAGVPLVIAEGIAQKAKKLAKVLPKVGMEWPWIHEIVGKKSEESSTETYLDGVVAGRPIFSYPNWRGGFRLRYGRTRFTGIMAKAIHPATMFLLDEFLTAGTQMKMELPGKGCITTPCDTIEPPIVKLKNGDVVRVETPEEAQRLRSDIVEILFLGDLLCPVGDFLKGGNKFLPSPYVEEWWAQEVKARGYEPQEFENALDAFSFAKRTGTPLHPRYLLYWSDLTADEFSTLVEYWQQRRIEDGRAYLPMAPGKRILEILGLPHRVIGDEVVIDEDWTYVLQRCVPEHYDGGDVLAAVSKAAGVEIRKKATHYIGARMGRPEKAKAKEMRGRLNVLFPTGLPKGRDLLKAANAQTQAELRRYRCPACNRIVPYRVCPFCGVKTKEERICRVCGRVVSEKTHCGKETLAYDKRPLMLRDYLDQLRQKFGSLPENLKGPEGLFSGERQPERLEKGVLRARHNVYVFKDGTIRFDATDIPITHFRPSEIGVSVERLRQLGYTEDIEGNPLTSKDQVVELFIQDVIIPEEAADYFLRVSQFIDDLLEEFYGLPRYYNYKDRQDLVGTLTIAMSPHTSTGVLTRIIGFTKFNGILAHPYVHCAKRRNTDGDEDGIFLLLDAFLNFSTHYLPESRGGTMDAPIVLMTRVNPEEVDDEVHEMEVNDYYPLEFYEGLEKGELKGITLVKDLLNSPARYRGGIKYTHEVYSLKVPERSKYSVLNTTLEKVRAQARLHKLIRAVDERDATTKVITSHLLPDIYGNLRAFARQTFRCSKCNAKYRRMPLRGKCKRCGGDIILSVTKGGIEKYLTPAMQLAEEFEVEEYVKNRLKLLKREIDEVFGSEDDGLLTFAD